MSKLYYYSNLAGVLGWAANAADFRKRNNLHGGYAVRVAHSEIAAPAGYTKTGRELAHEPATKGVESTFKRTKGGSVNFYELGLAILADGMTGIKERE